MLDLRSVASLLCGLLCCASAVTAGAPEAASQDSKEIKKPVVSLKASPQMGFSPARVVLTADIAGGPDDYEDFYCATVEWVWGDGTTSEATNDCEPYQTGKSEIKRHFITEHVFRAPGSFRVQFRLKKRDKIVGSAMASVRVNPGLGDSGPSY
jgi:hypothetical protein